MLGDHGSTARNLLIHTVRRGLDELIRVVKQLSFLQRLFVVLPHGCLVQCVVQSIMCPGLVDRDITALPGDKKTKKHMKVL